VNEILGRWLRPFLSAMRAGLRATAALLHILALGAKRIARFAPLRAGVRVLALSSALAGIGIGVGATCLVRVRPGEIGVRQVDFGGRGIVERDYGPGLYLSLPFYESWHLVDGTTQVLSFAWETEGGDFDILDVRTRDGNVVKLGASVVHRVRKGEAWQLVRDGLKSAWRRRVRATAETVLAQELATLSTEEIAATEPRLLCSAGVTRKLDALLAEDHVEVESVLVTQVWFGPQYEKKLQAKQLAAQQSLLQEAATGVDAQRAKIEVFQQEIENSARTIAADWDRRIAERSAQGRGEIAAVRSGTKFYDETRRAAAKADRDRLAFEGDQLIARSEGLKDSLMRKALSTGGGRMWLARQAAGNLNIRQVTLNSNDPSVPSVLDLDAMVKLLVGAPVGSSH
jgi:hypothetical protein